MRVLLDLSNLGLAHGSEGTRTGIFRATEFLVKELLRLRELELGFAALESYAAEAQLVRYDRSVGGLLEGGWISAWEAPGTTLEATVALIDRLEEAGEGSADGRRLLAELGLLNRLARPKVLGEEFELYHSLKHPLRPRERIRARARVLTVHDMVPILFPELSEERFVREHEAMMTSLDKTSDWIVCNSECTRRDACRLLPLSPERAFLTPFAADARVFHPHPPGAQRDEVLRRRGLAGRNYLLSLCTLEPRKNLVAVVEAFFALLDRDPASDLTLALVGPTGWKSGPLFERIEARPDLRDRILLLGYLPDEELSAIYSGARAFVYASLYEGFGLPPLEAMQCGVPVVTSTAGSLPEVVGDAALTVDPHDALGLTEALQRVLEEDGLAQSLGERGIARAGAFTWTRTAEATAEAYREIVARS